MIRFSAFRCGAVLAAALCVLAPAARSHEPPSPPAPAPTAAPPAQTLFVDARVFDGRAATPAAGVHVLVENNRIAKISATPIAVGPGATVIQAAGRTLMPGLIDAHTHVMMSEISQPAALTADIGFLNIVAARGAEAMLMRGFTTVRDVGGPSFGLKRAIDRGITVGPRIYPSGAFLSQTGGHGDFRLPNEVPRESNAPLSFHERIGVGAIADGTEQVILRAREQLRQGASQLKLMAGGGVASPYDPLDVTQYTEEEFRAAVVAAENWGTYVTVHAYTPRAIQSALRAGVKCIEHGQLMDEPTAKMIADKGAWLSLQPFLDDEDANPMTGESRVKQLQMVAGTDTAYRLARKYRIRTAFGTDTLFDPSLGARQGKQLAKLVRWYTPAEILKMATADNAELLALSGPRNPYPGKLGVVEEGALADLLLVEGDPLKDIALLADPARNFVVIMKDGKVYKNAVR